MTNNNPICENISYICYEAYRAYSITQKDYSYGPWDKFRADYELWVPIIEEVLAGNLSDVKSIHSHWCSLMEAKGWQYAPSRSVSDCVHYGIIDFTKCSPIFLKRWDFILAICAIFMPKSLCEDKSVKRRKGRPKKNTLADNDTSD